MNALGNLRLSRLGGGQKTGAELMELVRPGTPVAARKLDGTTFFGEALCEAPGGGWFLGIKSGAGTPLLVNDTNVLNVAGEPRKDEDPLLGPKITPEQAHEACAPKVSVTQMLDGAYRVAVDYGVFTNFYEMNSHPASMAGSNRFIGSTLFPEFKAETGKPLKDGVPPSMLASISERAVEGVDLWVALSEGSARTPLAFRRWADITTEHHSKYPLAAMNGISRVIFNEKLNIGLEIAQDGRAWLQTGHPLKTNMPGIEIAAESRAKLEADPVAALVELAGPERARAFLKSVVEAHPGENWDRAFDGKGGESTLSDVGPVSLKAVSQISIHDAEGKPADVIHEGEVFSAYRAVGSGYIVEIKGLGETWIPRALVSASPLHEGMDFDAWYRLAADHFKLRTGKDMGGVVDIENARQAHAWSSAPSNAMLYAVGRISDYKRSMGESVVREAHTMPYDAWKNEVLATIDAAIEKFGFSIVGGYASIYDIPEQKLIGGWEAGADPAMAARVFLVYTNVAESVPAVQGNKLDERTAVSIMPGQSGEAVMPHSEVNMHMRVAGKRMKFKYNGYHSGVQLWTLGDNGMSIPFSAPILPGEAGIFSGHLNPDGTVGPETAPGEGYYYPEHYNRATRKIAEAAKPVRESFKPLSESDLETDIQNTIVDLMRSAGYPEENFTVAYMQGGGIGVMGPEKAIAQLKWLMVGRPEFRIEPFTSAYTMPGRTGFKFFVSEGTALDTYQAKSSEIDELERRAMNIAREKGAGSPEAVALSKQAHALRLKLMGEAKLRENYYEKGNRVVEKPTGKLGTVAHVYDSAPGGFGGWMLDIVFDDMPSKVRTVNISNLRRAEVADETPISLESVKGKTGAQIAEMFKGAAKADALKSLHGLIGESVLDEPLVAVLREAVKMVGEATIRVTSAYAGPKPGDHFYMYGVEIPAGFVGVYAGDRAFVIARDENPESPSWGNFIVDTSRHREVFPGTHPLDAKRESILPGGSKPMPAGWDTQRAWVVANAVVSGTDNAWKAALPKDPNGQEVPFLVRVGDSKDRALDELTMLLYQMGYVGDTAPFPTHIAEGKLREAAKFMIHFEGSPYSNELYDERGREIFDLAKAVEYATEAHGRKGWEVYNGTEAAEAPDGYRTDEAKITLSKGFHERLVSRGIKVEQETTAKTLREAYDVAATSLAAVREPVFVECFEFLKRLGERTLLEYHDPDILVGAARMFWVLYWADREEEAGRPLGGDIWVSAPLTPPSAVAHATKELEKLSAANDGKSVKELYQLAVAAGYPKNMRDFGGDLVLSMLGHGAGLHDYIKRDAAFKVGYASDFYEGKKPKMRKFSY